MNTATVALFLSCLLNYTQGIVLPQEAGLVSRAATTDADLSAALSERDGAGSLSPLPTCTAPNTAICFGYRTAICDANLEVIKVLPEPCKPAWSNQERSVEPRQPVEYSYNAPYEGTEWCSNVGHVVCNGTAGVFGICQQWPGNVLAAKMQALPTGMKCQGSEVVAA